MKLKDMRTKSDKELVSHELKIRTEIAKLKQEQITKRDSNGPEIATLKKEIARALTVRKEMQLAEGQKKTERSKDA